MVESNDKEASPVRRGWRHYEGTLKCMSCGAEFDDGIMQYLGDDVPKFCPDCGAYMTFALPLALKDESVNVDTGCIHCNQFDGTGCRLTGVVFPDYFNVSAKPKSCPVVEVG